MSISSWMRATSSILLMACILMGIICVEWFSFLPRTRCLNFSRSIASSENSWSRMLESKILTKAGRDLIWLIYSSRNTCCAPYSISTLLTSRIFFWTTFLQTLTPLLILARNLWSSYSAYNSFLLSMMNRLQTLVVIRTASLWSLSSSLSLS